MRHLVTWALAMSWGAVFADAGTLASPTGDVYEVEFRFHADELPMGEPGAPDGMAALTPVILESGSAGFLAWGDGCWNEVSASGVVPVPTMVDEIIRTNFPQFNVKRDVPVTDLVGFTADTFKLYESRPYQTYKAEWGKPYTFVLYRGEKPAGVVMLGGGQSHAQNVKYLIARMYCKKLGMPYINFYLQMPNEREYVIQRIKDLMLGH